MRISLINSYRSDAAPKGSFCRRHSLGRTNKEKKSTDYTD